MGDRHARAPSSGLQGVLPERAGLHNSVDDCNTTSFSLVSAAHQRRQPVIVPHIRISDYVSDTHSSPGQHTRQTHLVLPQGEQTVLFSRDSTKVSPGQHPISTTAQVHRDCSSADISRSAHRRGDTPHTGIIRA